MRAEARETYLRLLKSAKSLGKDSKLNVLSTTYYNLACLDSLEGKKAEAIEWLEKSIREGYIDREWIGRDGDLDPIRGEAAYKVLLANEKLFKEPDPR